MVNLEEYMNLLWGTTVSNNIRNFKQQIITIGAHSGVIFIFHLYKIPFSIVANITELLVEISTNKWARASHEIASYI